MTAFKYKGQMLEKLWSKGNSPPRWVGMGVGTAGMEKSMELPHLSDFIELKRVRALLWIKLWLNRMLWLIWFSIQTITTFSISAIKLFWFLTVSVITWVTLLISLENLPFAFTAWLTLWCKKPPFQPLSAIYMHSSLRLVISSFLLCLSLENLEGVVGY